MTKAWWKHPLFVSLAAFLLALTAIVVFSVLTVARALTPKRTDRALTAGELSAVQSAFTLMQSRGLTDQAALGRQIAARQLWRAATPADPYLKRAEQEGDTPFAYTLSSGRHPSAIVLAPRFFTDTSPTARAALMIHEMAHYRAYVQTGRSEEFDGYRAEYDTHKQLGLSETDGLTYFAMLDGVVEYVVPRLPAYKTRPDVQWYMSQNSGG